MAKPREDARRAMPLRHAGAAEFRPVHFSPVVRNDRGVPLEFDCFMRRHRGAVKPIDD